MLDSEIMNFNLENSQAILNAAQEVLETTGQLWITIEDQEYYLPELIKEIKILLDLDVATAACI